MEKSLKEQELFYAYLDGKHTAMLPYSEGQEFLYRYSISYAPSKEAAYRFIEGYRNMVKGINQTV